VTVVKHENCNESYRQYHIRTLNEILQNYLTHYNWPTVIINILIDYSISPFGIFTFGGCEERERELPSEQAVFIKPSLDHHGKATGDIEIEQLPSMPSARNYAPATRIDEYIYISGGLEIDYKPVSSMIRYHIPNRTWSSCPPMLSARAGHCMVRLPEPKCHCLMVIGGLGDAGNILSCEIFNTLTNEWCHAPSMATTRLNFGSCVLNHRIYVFGSKSDTSSAYDIKTNAWCEILQSPMRDDDILGGVNGVPVVVGDDTILLIGNDSHRRIEEYTPSTDTWRILPWELPDERRYHYGVAYDSSTGSLIVLGGHDPKHCSMSTYIRCQPLHLKTKKMDRMFS
jgi:hypothetical protein